MVLVLALTATCLAGEVQMPGAPQPPPPPAGGQSAMNTSEKADDVGGGIWDGLAIDLLFFLF
jgi:hypothetical protein